ncbi:serine protein kinase [Aspergillus campestris IBT 28561]|uniref:Serine protein kinase n=1 Tax=Aspergillus campestris (strain IBT 28561) TaxID=1392248 RepID=A0A2I1D096_ASPC2|nr:serine protein kinase [Aspergillus campestris IBT 28561]PKY03296.1 serine protein kinase [Aspergillus campestris IBT 28561]
MASVLPNNSYAYYSTEQATIILSTEKYIIDDKFKFTTDTCLVYAEELEITSSITARGKSIGLFCHTLTVSNGVTIGVSGETGAAGIPNINEDGGSGGNGKDAGNVWICVRSVPGEKAFQNLTIEAYGGTGGSGGDSTISDKEDKDKPKETRGGAGGDGGNGGDIELLFGTAETDAVVALQKIYRRSWPEQVLCLTEPVLSDSLPGCLSAGDEEVLQVLKSLSGVLQDLAVHLEVLSKAGLNKEIQDNASSLMQEVHTNLATKDEAPKDVTTETVTLFEKTLKSVRSISLETGTADATQILAAAQKAIEKVSPRKDSQLVSLIRNLEKRLQADLANMESAAYDFTKNNSRGAGGVGGYGTKEGGFRSQNGANGKAGLNSGQSRATILPFKGFEEDLDVLQAYIFPEQCQMLLNKADDIFFSSNTDDWKRAYALYNILVGRLQVLNAFQGERSGLLDALEGLETKLNVTSNPVLQLKSVYEQAISRRNRLLLCQDMFGHVDSWVPRLSFGFYAQSVEERFQVLDSTEKLTAAYEEAVQNDNDVHTLVDQGISKMADAQKEAEAKIDLLTSPNGPLATGVSKIAFLTKDIRVKRQLLVDELSKIRFKNNLDWTIFLRGASALVSTYRDPASILDQVKTGYDLYQEGTGGSVKNLEGDVVKREYIIDQLEQCGDTLDSLEQALKTKKNNEIGIDDPGALKILSTADDIRKILREFKNAIEPADLKSIEGALDTFVAVTLDRNSAVLDYNASIQLLIEAINNRDYSKSQGETLGQKRHTLNPKSPAILFWLRKTRDTMRLELMQRLNYESRAIRFWGLQKELDFSHPAPLNSVTQLQDSQLNLKKAFENCLQGYANNIRVTWPRYENDKGLLYALTKEELEAFKRRQVLTTSNGDDGVYSASIRLEPGASPFGTGRADVRINQVRLWLLGVQVNPDNALRKRLLVKISHVGNETLEDTERKRFEFAHDAVNIQFEYDTARVQGVDDFSSEFVFGKQGLEDNWSGGDTQLTASTFAAIGPFTEWHFDIRESENQGLDMGLVTAAYVEFRGANRPFSVDYGEPTRSELE